MIGRRVWVFDPNRTVYRRDASGKAIGCPIWREHWRPAIICRETPKFWLVGHGLDHDVTLSRCLAKLPKKGELPNDVVFDEAEIDRRMWVTKHRLLLANKIRAIECPDTLRKIAELIGFEPD